MWFRLSREMEEVSSTLRIDMVCMNKKVKTKYSISVLDGWVNVCEEDG